MPILVGGPTVTEAEKAEIVARTIKEFLASTMVDAFGNTITYQTAIKRGATAYPYVISGGPLEKRVAAVEALSKTEATDQDAIQSALQKPILP